MADFEFQSPEEIQVALGERLRQLRLRADVTQDALAAKAGISVRALRALEKGEGSSLITLVRVLKALGAASGLDAIAPEPTISPMALLERGKAPQRARGR
jgi:transcriptional regulator with XRE-family HTH domain